MGEVQRSAPSLKTEYLYPGVKAITNQFTDKLTDNWMGSLFGENDDFGQAMGNIFSNGITSVSDTFTKNLIKGDSLTAGLGKNVGTTLGGVGAGVAGNLLGKGITSLGGNTALSRGLGQGLATSIGNIGGIVSSIKNLNSANTALNAVKGMNTSSSLLKALMLKDVSKVNTPLKSAAITNLAGTGAAIVGSALSAALGPSKEYNGRYGNITRNMDMAYDLINAGVGFVPGVGTAISGVMTLNKGLSNLFGSTDGMTRTDAILGSAFMPAPVKWANMWGSSTTGTFNNLSWLNDEKATSFMGNAFGNLNDRFKRAREEAGKTYGTFSQGAKREALDNIDFANKAWALIMNMADENELAKIRSLYMTSINNQRYALNIQGGFSPVSFGRMGMKILNNSIPHEVGQRLLSGAALINSGLRILSAQGGTKVPKKLVPFEIIGEGQLDPTLAYRNFTINGKPAKLLSANYNTDMGKVQYEDGSEEEIRLAPNFWLNPKSSNSKKIPMLDTFREGITNQAANEMADEYVDRVTPKAEDLFNIATLGGLNNLSPTQWGRRAWDGLQLLQGKMPLSNYMNSWFYGNNGIVSDEYAKEHPYRAAAANLVGDLATFGTASALRKMPGYGYRRVSTKSPSTIGWEDATKTPQITADIETTSKQGTTALSLEEILKAFNQARQWHLNRINSPGYKDRALRAGFTEEEIPQLQQLLTRLINNLKLLNKEKLFPSHFSYEDGFGKMNAEYWLIPTNKGAFLGIGFYNPNLSYDEAVSKFIHEFGHGATFGLNGNETTGVAGRLSKQFPLITKAVLYNKSLFPEVTKETVKKVFPYAAENGMLEYYSKPTELLARGYEFMRDFGNSWWKLKHSGKPFGSLDVINNAANSRLNSNLFRGFTGNLGANNFQKNALGISVPLGLGGYGLYNSNLQK